MVDSVWNGRRNESNKSGDSSLHDWFSKSRASDGTPGWVQLGGKYAGKPCAKQPGQTTKPKCGSSKMKRNLDKGEEEAAFRRKNREDPNPNRKGKAKNVATEEMNLDEKCWKGYTQKGMKKKGNRVVPNCVPVGEAKNIHGDIEVPSGNGGKLKKLASKAAQRIDTDVDGDVEKNDKSKGEYGEFVPTGGDPRKAHGRQFTSIKVKSVKEALGEIDTVDEGIKMTLVKAIDKTKPAPLSKRAAIRQKLVKSEIESAAKKSKKRRFSGLAASEKASKAQKYMSPAAKTTAAESYEIDKKAHRAAQKSAKIGKLARGTDNPGEKAAAERKAKGPKLFGEESAAWQRKAGKNKEGGLNEKGRKSYERENPGSDLKAPSKKVGNPRRKSFCARMSGMKKKLTSSKTANDPNSRINKSLRAWNC